MPTITAVGFIEMRIAKVVGFGPPLAFVSPAVVEDANRRL